MTRPRKRSAAEVESLVKARAERRKQLADDRRRDKLYLLRKQQVDVLFGYRDRLRNDKGRSRTIEENRVTLLAMIACM